MIEQIVLNGRKIEYELLYKRVKNINLRIRSDKTVSVSASKRVSKKQIEDFLQEKAEFIEKALQNFEKKAQKPKIQYFSEQEICGVITGMCEKVYPYFAKQGIPYPKITFRKMVSRWGSCHPQKKVLTFNTNLMYAPKDCILYVVLHEFTHFLQANHSPQFYAELEKVCPDWKNSRKMLKEIHLR